MRKCLENLNKMKTNRKIFCLEFEKENSLLGNLKKVNFYPLNPPILAKTKNHSTFFDEFM